MCGEAGALETPSVGTSYEVWELSFWRITTVPSQKWGVAARLGPQPRGGATNNLQKVEETPPAMLRSSLRGSLHSLHAPFQIGAPAPLNTDASLVSVRTRYRSFQISLEPRNRRKDILFRKDGTSSRGSVELRDAPNQRGEVGFFVH